MLQNRMAWPWPLHSKMSKPQKDSSSWLLMASQLNSIESNGGFDHQVARARFIPILQILTFTTNTPVPSDPRMPGYEKECIVAV